MNDPRKKINCFGCIDTVEYWKSRALAAESCIKEKEEGKYMLSKIEADFENWKRVRDYFEGERAKENHNFQ